MIDELEYPFQCTNILRNKRRIKRKIEQNVSINPGYLPEVRIALLSGATIGHIADILELFLLNFGIKPEFYIGDYNRYYEEIMFPNNSLINFKPNLIFLNTTTRNESLDCYYKLHNVWEKIHETYACTIIQNNFEISRNFPSDKAADINSLNQKIYDYKRDHSDFHVNDVNLLSAQVGFNEWFSDEDYYLYGYALSVRSIPIIAHNIALIIKSIYGKDQKCLVLDLDNTLWGGTVGDLGNQNIEISNDTATGKAYLQFQKYVKSLKERGVILAVCSKNEQQIAKSAFDNPNMILKLSDFQAFVANWDIKSKNIKQIAETLNILPESIVFIDDNPAEQEEVRAMLPMVKIPRASGVLEFIEYLEMGGYFRFVATNDDDKNRTIYYTQNMERDKHKERFQNYSEYLLFLQMTAYFSDFNSDNIDRVVQLINKTNQFNLTTRRYTKSEILEIAQMRDKYITIAASLEDRFGNNGLVCALIAEIKGTKAYINLWVMSCRVFKRDLELAMFDRLMDILIAAKTVTEVNGLYIETGKNFYVKDLYETLGFSSVEPKKGVFNLSIDSNYSHKNKTIVIKDLEDRNQNE